MGSRRGYYILLRYLFPVDGDYRSYRIRSTTYRCPAVTAIVVLFASVALPYARR